MRFGQQFLPPLALGIVVAIATTPVVLQVPGLQIQSFPTPTLTPTSVNISGEEDAIIEDRARYGQPAQKPLNGCPQMFDAPTLDCSLCGGEDPSAPGTCTDPLRDGGWKCACNVTPSATATTSVVITTVGSDVATGTYELQTLTQYANLREQITMLTVISQTATTSADSGLETVAAVVLAGGVAWFLADSAGGAAAVSALEPPTKADNHDDDKSCPDPKGKCDDCGGNHGMCTTGTDSGCGCEEDECPADGADDQPVCTDETCDGKDGQCTTGQYEGCNCKQPECPDLNKETFWCSDCGGAGDDGLCKGDPEDDNIWKGCECTPTPDWSQQSPPLKRKNVQAHRDAIKNCPKIVYPPKPSAMPTALPSAKCDTTQISGVPNNVFSPGIYSNFCNTLNGGDKTKQFTQTVDSKGNVVTTSKIKTRELAGRTPPPNADLYNGYTFDLNWSGGDGSCASECSDVFHAMVASPCGQTAGDQNIMASQTTLDTGCGIYSYTITKPGPKTVAPTRQDQWLCTNSALTFNKKFTLANAEDAVSQFCVGDTALLQAALPVSNTYSYEDVNILLKFGWRADGQDGCGQITNADGSYQNTVNKNQCSDYLLRAVNSCDTKTRTEKYGGTYMWSSPFGCIDFTVLGTDGGEGIGR